MFLHIFTIADSAHAIVTFNFKSPIKKTSVSLILTDFLKWLLAITGSIALVAMIISGLLYINSRGNPQQAKKAKRALSLSLAGLILILMSYIFLAILDQIFA